MTLFSKPNRHALSGHEFLPHFAGAPCAKHEQVGPGDKLRVGTSDAHLDVEQSVSLFNFRDFFNEHSGLCDHVASVLFFGGGASGRDGFHRLNGKGERSVNLDRCSNPTTFEVAA